jgi:hypothetical protein
VLGEIVGGGKLNVDKMIDLAKSKKWKMIDQWSYISKNFVSLNLTWTDFLLLFLLFLKALKHRRLFVEMR